MTRGTVGETIVVRPTNNVYTVLVAVAIVVEIIGLIALFKQAAQIMPPGLLK